MSAVQLPAAAPPVRATSANAGARTGGHAAAGARAPRAALRALKFSASAETGLAIGVVAIVALLIVPLPPFVLDACLALSFALSLVIMLVTLSSRDPLEFNMFPSLLLLITLLRLGLNVSSTRLILSTGHAGQVISAFGNFVIGGNPVVGLVIFLILVVINFMVITKGAGRIAEVAARFTLDAMPGRQMSIDADLSAGLIDETEARRRREEVSRYADFYGSMDGAAKFVRGDAVAGLVITAINLLGGFVIGMTQLGMSAGDSLRTFSTLTVGDGLVTQIPALIVSTAAGILVTYGSSGVAVGPSIVTQLTRAPRALWTTSGILVAFGLVPGLPTLPFLLLAVVSGVLAWRAGRPQPIEVAAKDSGSAANPIAAPAPREIVTVDPLEIEVGYALVPLVDETQGGDLLQRLAVLRKQLALELGLLVPAVRVRDNIQLAAGEYVIKLRGVRVGGSELFLRSLLAIDTGGARGTLEGTPVRDPSFQMPAVWIGPDRRATAEAQGWNVVEPATVLTTHLIETIRFHAADLLSRQAVRELLDGLKEAHPALVEDVVPGKLSVGAVQRVLREGVPIRDLVTILETLSDAADQTKDPEALTEQVRRSLAPRIAELIGAAHGPVRAVMVGPRLEVALMQWFGPRRDAAGTFDPAVLSQALHGLTEIARRVGAEGAMPPLVTPPGLRVGIRRLVEPVLPRMPVVALNELPPQTPIETLEVWEMNHAA